MLVIALFQFTEEKQSKIALWEEFRDGNTEQLILFIKSDQYLYF